MELLLMIVAPLPLGRFVRSRMVAVVTYVAMFAVLFTFQSMALVIDWAGGSQAAFGPFPDATDQKVFEYGAINLIILGVGIGLVHLGARWRARREARTAGTVSLEPAGTRS